MRMKNMMLFADTRTGSSVLFNLIRQIYHTHRQSKQDDKLIDCIAEPWHAGVIHYFYGAEIYYELYGNNHCSDIYSYANLKDEPWSMLRSIHDNVYRISYGCKHIWSHLTEGTNYSLLLKSINEGHRIIFLDRRAIGKKSLSHLLARQTEQWRRYTSAPKFENVDLQMLRVLCDRYKRTKHDYRVFLEEYANDVYYITYEDIFHLNTYEEKLSKFQEVVEFLGFDRDDAIRTNIEEPLNPKQQQNTDDILRTIPNIKDVCRFIHDEYGERIIPDQ